MSFNIKDVAKLANVSITTVSRVMNNNYPVKKETRERVLSVVEELNYMPNAQARSLITKKTSIIGIIVPGITNLFFSTIVEAIEGKLKEDSYSVFLCNCNGDIKEEIKMAEDMVGRRVDGIIVIDPCIKNIKDGFYKTIEKSIPLIIVSGLIENQFIASVTYNEEKGTFEALKYLINLGHKKIAFIRGEKSHSYDIKEMIYKKVIDEYRLNYYKIIRLGGGNSIEVVENTERELAQVLEKDDRPTAIFACNDLMAVGVINTANILNISIPKELSLISCDNTLISKISNPKITSVNLHIKEVGEKAANMMISILKKEIFGEKIIIQTELVIRDSSDIIYK